MHFGNLGAISPELAQLLDETYRMADEMQQNLYLDFDPSTGHFSYHQYAGIDPSLAAMLDDVNRIVHEVQYELAYQDATGHWVPHYTPDYGYADPMMSGLPVMPGVSSDVVSTLDMINNMMSGVSDVASGEASMEQMQQMIRQAEFMSGLTQGIVAQNEVYHSVGQHQQQMAFVQQISDAEYEAWRTHMEGQILIGEVEYYLGP